jgi:hypothetical protein
MQTATRPQEDDPDALRSLGDILDVLENTTRDGSISIGDVLDEVGVRSFAPIILIPALILFSPLSGIIGLPTIGATFIFLITIQKLFGRPQVWMPAILKRRRVKEERLKKAIGWLRKPTGWVDRHTHKRLTVLVSRPANMFTLLLIMGICLIIPVLEILPMVTSIFAAAISFLAIGLLARDGLFTLLGYIQAAASCAVIWWMISAGIGGFGG